ncbi:hypothetical protein [Bartonella sp. LJL80]
MSRKAAAYTQADIRRICAGAKLEGAPVVHITFPSGVKFSIPLDKESAIDDYMDKTSTKSEDFFTL